MNTLKKISGGTFLLLALLPVITGCLLLAGRLCIQLQMRRELKQQPLTSVTLHPKEIAWIENGKELLIGNAMFDVEEVSYNADGSITVQGLYDADEANIIQAMQQAMNSGSDNAIHQLVIKLFDVQLYCSAKSNVALLYPKIISVQYKPHKESLYVATFCEVIIPPPKA